MSTSHKDYVAIAKILEVAPQGNAEEYRRAIACMIADHFAAWNANFDVVRFLEACNAR